MLSYRKALTCPIFFSHYAVKRENRKTTDVKALRDNFPMVGISVYSSHILTAIIQVFQYKESLGETDL